MEAILSVILLKATSKGIFEEFLHQRQLELISKLKRHDVSAKNHITYSLSAISSVLCIVHQTFYQVNRLVNFTLTLEGHSQTTLARFCPLLTTYLLSTYPLLTYFITGSTRLNLFIHSRLKCLEGVPVL